MSKPFSPTPHPVLALPTAAQAAALGEARWRELMIRREEIIRGEKADPFLNCWEPPIWQVADAIMGFPWVEPVWAEKMRLRLGFKKPAPVVLVNGGNRGGKSQWGSHRVTRILRGPWRRRARAWALHSTLAMSRQYQQPLFYDYLPAGLKGQTIKSATTYIAYKQKTGFSEEQFVLPPQEPGLSGSDCVFKAYEQEKTDIEGGNLDVVWPDELVPADWIETLEFRIAEKQGWMPITFTPVNGYNDTVKMFQDGAETVMESVAFLLPKDGGPPDVARALGLTDAEFAEVQAAGVEKRASLYPQSRPEDCHKWIEETSNAEHSTLNAEHSNGAGHRPDATNPINAGQLPIPAGREFETVPRVMKCVSEGEKRAVVFFYSSDNPFGNPKGIAEVVLGKPAAFIKERFYGLATKHMAGRFPKFDRDVHTCEAAAVPGEGTNYQFIDPCSGRNFYMLWVRVTPEQVFVYREWPGPYYIQGIGVPGPWALPDPKKADGRPGPAQDTFGWGYRAYKLQIAELEKWKDLERGNAEHSTPNAERSSGGGLAWIDELDEAKGSAEDVRERKIDARFASTPKLENDRPKTLLTDFEDIGLYLLPARGDDIAHGIQCINDLLNYDEEKPVDYFNKPKLIISRECANLIFALQTWTGKDGQKGATKDPVETLYRFATDDCPYLGSQVEDEEENEESEFEERPRNHY